MMNGTNGSGMGVMMWMMSRSNSPAPRADLSDLTPEQRLGLLERRSQQVARELAATRADRGRSGVSDA